MAGLSQQLQHCEQVIVKQNSLLRDKDASLTLLQKQTDLAVADRALIESRFNTTLNQLLSLQAQVQEYDVLARSSRQEVTDLRQLLTNLSGVTTMSGGLRAMTSLNPMMSLAYPGAYSGAYPYAGRGAPLEGSSAVHSLRARLAAVQQNQVFLVG